MSRAPRYVSRAVGLGFVVAVVCGVSGAFVGEPVVAALGRVVNHHELVLRGLGWCWGGLPFVVLVAAYTQRHRLSQRAKQVAAYTLTIWAASAALLIPGRHSNLEERFGSANLDARPLAFGWAAGFLSTFATVLLVALLIIGWRKLTRIVTKQSVVLLNRAITILWSLLAAAGFVTALIVPLP